MPVYSNASLPVWKQPKLKIMDTRRSYLYFAFTYRFFSYGEGGQAKCGRDVLKA